MPQAKQTGPAGYRAAVDLTYRPSGASRSSTEERDVPAGRKLPADFPEKSLPWLRRQGLIEPIEEAEDRRTARASDRRAEAEEATQTTMKTRARGSDIRRTTVEVPPTIEGGEPVTLESETALGESAEEQGASPLPADLGEGAPMEIGPVQKDAEPGPAQTEIGPEGAATVTEGEEA